MSVQCPYFAVHNFFRLRLKHLQVGDGVSKKAALGYDLSVGTGRRLGKIYKVTNFTPLAHYNKRPALRPRGCVVIFLIEYTKQSPRPAGGRLKSPKYNCHFTFLFTSHPIYGHTILSCVPRPTVWAANHPSTKHCASTGPG